MSAKVELFEDFDAVARDADGALAREARPSLFDRLEWFRMVRDHAPPEGRPLVIRSRDERASAWLFLAVNGTSARALSNWYCLRFGTVIDGDDAAAATDELVRGLRKAGVSRLFLSPVAADDPLPAALKRRSWLVRRSESTVNWTIRTTGLSFAEYWAARPSRLRNTVKRRAKSAALSLVVHRAFDGSAWADYESVYQASWKPAEGSPAMLRELAEREGAAGTLRLGLAYREGQPVAAQLWTVENGVATIHKLAYREDSKQHSPGAILSAEMFRGAIDEDRVDLIDFGIGDDGYKSEWMQDSAPLYSVTAYDLLSPSGIAGVARLALSKLVPGRGKH